MAVGNRGGRPPKPTALKLVQGTARPDRVNDDEPKPDQGMPKVPSWLSPAARRHWRTIAPLLADMQVLTVADGTALGLLADVLAEWVEARAVVRKLGMVYESRTLKAHSQRADADEEEFDPTALSVMIRQRPEVAIAQDAWKRARAMLADFGLNPSARSRLHVGKKDEEVDPLEALLRAKG